MSAAKTTENLKKVKQEPIRIEKNMLNMQERGSGEGSRLVANTGEAHLQEQGLEWFSCQTWSKLFGVHDVPCYSVSV